ncbi:piggyBac transposable element-derived protein 4-like [Tachysurus ichikawai]
MLRGIKRIINTAEVAEMQSDPSSDLQDTSTSDTTHSGESDAEFVVAASSYSVDSSTEAEVYSEDSESRGDGYQPPWASHHKKWTEVDTTDLRAYMGLLIFGGIYRSRGESTCSILSALPAASRAPIGGHSSTEKRAPPSCTSSCCTEREQPSLQQSLLSHNHQQSLECTSSAGTRKEGAAQMLKKGP